MEFNSFGPTYDEPPITMMLIEDDDDIPTIVGNEVSRQIQFLYADLSDQISTFKLLLLGMMLGLVLSYRCHERPTPRTVVVTGDPVDDKQESV